MKKRRKKWVNLFQPQTAIYQWNLNSQKRININQGGTSSGKTYSILQVLYTLAFNNPRTITTVVGQDIPNLKVGALRDFKRIINTNEFIRQSVVRYNKTERIFELWNGSIIEFNSYSDEQDAKSGKRDFLFMNEANGIDYSIYNQLAMRTGTKIFIDYNPSASFWVHERILGTPESIRFISNFTHNPYASEDVIRHVMTYKTRDPESWRVYGLGLTGNITGLVFRNVKYVEEFPMGARKLAYGLDFGFVNDPTALIQCGLYGGQIYLKELIYDYALTNAAIIEKMKALNIGGTAEIIADSSDPKTISEIRAAGFNIIPSKKGPDSIRAGLNLMNMYPINITAESQNMKKEQMNYKWKVKDKVPLNVPVDAWNHGWDAARYWALLKLTNSAAVLRPVRR